MKRVYLHSKKLKNFPERVAVAQALTLHFPKSMIGLRIGLKTYG